MATVCRAYWNGILHAALVLIQFGISVGLKNYWNRIVKCVHQKRRRFVATNYRMHGDSTTCMETYGNGVGIKMTGAEWIAAVLGTILPCVVHLKKEAIAHQLDVTATAVSGLSEVALKTPGGSSEKQEVSWEFDPTGSAYWVFQELF